MKIQHKYLLPAIMLTVIGGSMIMAPIASARGNEGGMKDAAFAKDLASRLGLSESKVQGALDEIWKTKRQQHEKNMSEKLDKLVTDGKITQAQKVALVKKQSEMKAQHESIMADTALTPEQKREKMRALHDSFQSWLSEQGLSDKIGFMGGKFGHVRGGPNR